MLRQTSLQALLDTLPKPAEHITASLAVHHAPVGELHHRRVTLQQLEKQTASAVHSENEEKKPRVHVGVAGFYNFDIAVATKPDQLLLLDANPNQALFWKDIVEMLKESPTADEFRERYASHLHDQEFMLSDSTLVPSRRNGDESRRYLEEAVWLKDPQQYGYIRHLALEDKIATHTINLIEDPKACHDLGNLLRSSGYSVASAYWSNIASYDHPHRKGRYTSKDEGVFGQETSRDIELAEHDKGITYPGRQFNNFFNPTSVYKCDGNFEGKKFDELPTFERIMRNTAEIGDAHTSHIYMHLEYKKKFRHGDPLIISEGPLARTHKKTRDRLARDYIGETPEQHTERLARLQEHDEQDRLR